MICFIYGVLLCSQFEEKRRLLIGNYNSSYGWLHIDFSTMFVLCEYYICLTYKEGTEICKAWVGAVVCEKRPQTSLMNRIIYKLLRQNDEMFMLYLSVRLSHHMHHMLR